MAEPVSTKATQNIVQDVGEQQILNEESSQQIQSRPFQPSQKDSDDKGLVLSKEDPSTGSTHGDENTVLRTTVPLKQLTRNPAVIKCSRCGAIGESRIELVPGESANTMAAVLCCLTGVLGVWIPYVVPSCKDAEHWCKACNFRVATVQKGGDIGDVKIDKYTAPKVPGEV